MSLTFPKPLGNPTQSNHLEEKQVTGSIPVFFFEAQEGYNITPPVPVPAQAQNSEIPDAGPPPGDAMDYTEAAILCLEFA